MGAARLQRALVALLVTVAAVWVASALAHGRPGLALLGVLVPMFGHGAVLGVEFVLLALLHGEDPTPRATPAELLRAWSRETWTALVVFGWRQPFRRHAVPDHLPPDALGRRGVVLVHGFLCNRGLWNPWLERLRAADVPCVAVTLDPVFGPIEAYAPTVDTGVQRLLDATGVPPLVVAHSMGGLAVREWLAQTRRVRDVHAVVTVGTPHHGTWLARFAFSANARQMRWHGQWLAGLAQREPPVAERPPFVCFYGHCDNIVFPPSTAVLPGAVAHHVRATGHVDMVFDDAVFAEVQRQLALPPR